MKFVLNKLKNKQGLFDLLKSLDDAKLWLINITHYDIRSLEQNAKLHAMLSDISQQATHLNESFGVDDWKRLLVWQFRKACIESDMDKITEYFKRAEFRIIPSLDGSGLVQLGAQTHKFPKYVMAGFIDWLEIYCAENDIKLRDNYQFDERYL